MPGKLWIVLGALLAAVAVSAGAVGTHFLKERLGWPVEKLVTYETAVRYQVYHAFALIVVGLLVARAASPWLTAAGSLFLLGIVLFSGGIYGWLFTGIKPFVHVVPVGGLSWIIGWVLLAVAALRLR